MYNIDEYIDRITKLAKRNKELNTQLHNLVGRYSNIQKQNEKYHDLLTRFSETQKPIGSQPEIPKADKKVQHLRTVSLLYITIHGFEELHHSDKKTDHIDVLDEIYIAIDKVAEEYNLNKIKSFGDNLMFAAGLKKEHRTNPINITLAANEIQSAVAEISNNHSTDPIWKIKMGIHTGPVLSIDCGTLPGPTSISGESLNVTCRLGESCPPGQINMSEMTYELVKEFFDISHLGTLPVKYKGNLNMYLVNGLTEELRTENSPFQRNETFYVRYGQIQFMDIQESILDLLEKNLPSNLYYHNVKHTVDVVTEVELIGWAEKLREKDILLLKVAALFHDAGHIVSYRHHEYEGTLLAKQILPRYNYSGEDIETICKLIMATMLPPQPQNKKEEVMCDSDLDYLGRTDFIPVSGMLFQELKERNMVGSWREWNEMQLKFIRNHQYFTETARNLREVNKQQQIERLKQLLDARNVDVNMEK